MELEENKHHNNSGKRPRVTNGVGLPANLDSKEQQHQDDDEDDGQRRNGGGGVGRGRSIDPWQHQLPSSRIYRVSRASGGKDRHSKVYTAKGLRDRRVRLSVSTAIQFYDLQDRLGYDQPSKAIEWLIKAAAAAINKLPSLDVFPKPPQVEEEEKPTEADLGEETGFDVQQPQHHLPTKSGCSSNSETSKGSVLSLSRSESRVKARERARERAAKDKEKDKDERGSHVVAAHQRNITPSLISQTSFTELLTGGGGGGGNGANAVDVVVTTRGESSPICIQKQISTADYFAQSGLFPQQQKVTHLLQSGFSAHSHYGGNSVYAMMPFNVPTAANTAVVAGDHPEMQQFSFVQDHLVPGPVVAPAGDYNLNFSISSGPAGFNRGTLQSNSPSEMPHHRQHNHGHSHLQRFSSTVDGSSLPFFFGAAATAASAPSAATNAANQYPPGFDGRLQLCYGDGFRHSDLKGKGKS